MIPTVRPSAVEANAGAPACGAVRKSARTTFNDYIRFLGLGLVLIVTVGVIRFAVGISGVPYERATHLTSITIVVFILAIVYGQRAAARRLGGYRRLVPLALLLSGTMYAVIVLAIAVEGLTGWRGYFHSPGSGYAPHGMSVRDHILGQLSVMSTMTVAIYGVMAIGYALSRHLAHLRNAFLLLAAVAIVRFAAGPAGVPYGFGSWITSLTFVSVALVGYYAYRAPVELGRYPHALLMGLLIAFATFHLEVYGFVVSDGLEMATYFTMSVPSGTTVPELIESQLKAVPVLLAVLMAAAGIGLALRKQDSAADAHR